MRRDVWASSQHPQYCYGVQKAFELGTDEERKQLAEQLKGHVWEALKCPNANYVIQMCVSSSRPHDTQFIADEIREQGNEAVSGAAQVARMRFGCRILQRQLEHYSDERQVGPLIDDILSDAVALCTHQYGNYVMKHILEHGPPEHKSRLCRILASRLADYKRDPKFGEDQFVCAVLSKALEKGCPEDKASLAAAILNVPCLLSKIADDRFGHETARRVLEVTADLLLWPLHQQARDQIQKAQHLRDKRYGRLVVQYMKQKPSKYSLTQRAGGA
jgi:hypothetical protein